jgi:hypothetical protein
MIDMTHIRVNEEVRARLVEQAKNEGVTVNDYIIKLINLRSAINSFVNNNGKEKEECIEPEKACLGSIAGQCATLVRWRSRVQIPPRA